MVRDDSCWFCENAGVVACPDCEDEPSSIGCLRCKGTGKLRCPECLGGETEGGLKEIGREFLNPTPKPRQN